MNKLEKYHPCTVTAAEVYVVIGNIEQTVEAPGC